MDWNWGVKTKDHDIRLTNVLSINRILIIIFQQCFEGSSETSIETRMRADMSLSLRLSVHTNFSCIP